MDLRTVRRALFEGDVVDAIQKLVGALDVRVENVREVALAYWKEIRAIIDKVEDRLGELEIFHQQT